MSYKIYMLEEGQMVSQSKHTLEIHGESTEWRKITSWNAAGKEKKEKSQIGRGSSFVGLVDQPLIDVFLAAAAKKLHFHKSSHE